MPQQVSDFKSASFSIRMNFIRTCIGSHIRIPAPLVFISCVICLFVLCCAKVNYKPIWVSPDPEVSEANIILNCDAAGVEKITAGLYMNNHRWRTFESQCSDLPIMTTAVAGGTYDLFIIFGRDKNGAVLYLAEQRDLLLETGKTYFLGDIKSHWFIPEVIGTVDNNQLTWNGVDGADAYEVVISDDIQFKNEMVRTTVSEPSFSPDLSEPRTYFWKVRAKHRLGYSSGWSETWSFSIAKKKNAPTK
jgi:hypothetical protein